MEVEIREEAASPRADPTMLLVNNSSAYPIADAPVIIIRAEEVLLVVLVLILWVAAIALFFNRWGKIRMLEPYQPKFQQNHRASCPLAPLSPPGITPQQRMSFSKYNVNCLTDTLYSGITSPNPIRRPRLNSVFVGSSTMAFVSPPRRVKSAIDIQHMVVNERSPFSLTGSIIPIVGSGRKPSITIDRPPCRHRPSISIEKPVSYYHQFRSRRASCQVDNRSMTRHRNFLSFETTPADRKMSITIDRPVISLEAPKEIAERPSVVVEVPRGGLAKMSSSFEQPASNEKPQTKRMCTSLDVNTIRLDSTSSSIAEEDCSSNSVSISLDESRITAPLLENLKSSDV